MTDADLEAARAVYLHALIQRGDAASGAWHTAFHAVEDRIVAFVYSPGPFTEQQMRDAFAALRTAAVARAELTNEHMMQVFAPVQIAVLGMRDDLTAHQQREEAAVAALRDELAALRAELAGALAALRERAA